MKLPTEPIISQAQAHFVPYSSHSRSASTFNAAKLQHSKTPKHIKFESSIFQSPPEEKTTHSIAQPAINSNKPLLKRKSYFSEPKSNHLAPIARVAVKPSPRQPLFATLALVARVYMADSGGNPEPGKVCNFIPKSSKKQNIRKRRPHEDEEDNSTYGGTSFPSQRKAAKPDGKLYFSSGPAKSSTSDGSAIFEFKSSKEIQIENDSRATATLETETEFSRDARAVRERVLKQAEEALQGKSKETGNEKLYKGIHGYTDYKAGFRRELTVASEKAGGSHGPLRASAHIRATTRFDYQPDICKDYKETGYCGYGDSCKFMHDRGDYKSGWQMEREWEEAEKTRKRNLALGQDDVDQSEDDDDDDEDGSLPFACFICRKPFVDPVVTKCNHYFCEHCALKHHSKNKKCFVCDKPTLGIFNTAHEIRKRMAAEGK